MNTTNNNTYPALSARERVFVEALVDSGVTRTTITRGDMRGAMNALGLAWPPAWIVKEHARRVGRGTYDVPEIAGVIAAINAMGDTTTTTDDTVVVLDESNGDEHVVGDVDADAIAELQSA